MTRQCPAPATARKKWHCWLWASSKGLTFATKTAAVSPVASRPASPLKASESFPSCGGR
eukprot:CAMPEP_0175443824 /NCGR_PEP_ID=MMETSP0095-20121207/58885_1 /TAXON_ID=311494 /ORGANISM="Alexandrium monilatum, Strain CCMP3105" /LENGTH=58 /DNA_ID=CAMNT_0016743941 /DNA_START=193 /DNA_END=366 /DNA_ORIENTATION=+